MKRKIVAGVAIAFGVGGIAAAIAASKPPSISEEQRAQFFATYQQALTNGSTESGSTGADKFALQAFGEMTPDQRDSILSIGSLYCGAKARGRIDQFMASLRKSVDAKDADSGTKAAVIASQNAAIEAGKTALCP